VSNEETNPTVEPPRADRRARRRTPIAVSMLARWTDDREHEQKINSRDISDCGIFFHSNSDIAIGTDVEVTFTVPSDPGAAGNRRLHVRGAIIRAEHGGDTTGYALRVISSELSETDDTVLQARHAVGRLAANDSSSDRSSRAWRAHLGLLACSGLIGLTVLVSLGIFITQYDGGPARAIAAVREMVAGIGSTPENVPAQDVLQNRAEGKRKPLRTVGLADARKKKAASRAAQHDAEPNPDASAAQVRSLEVDSTSQPRTVAFNNHDVQTLDFQKGKLVSPLGYIGELSSPSGILVGPLPAGSSASTPATTEAATAMSSSTAVVLLAVVSRDGSVEDVQRASGSVEFAPAAIAAIRHWKFQSDPNGAMRRQIYVTVNFTISTE
jgi:TonB family protein